MARHTGVIAWLTLVVSLVIAGNLVMDLVFEEPDLGELWKTIAGAPSEILDRIEERRRTEGVHLDVDLPLEVLAMRLGGYALDACGEEPDLGLGAFGALWRGLRATMLPVGRAAP